MTVPPKSREMLCAELACQENSLPCCPPVWELASRVSVVVSELLRLFSCMPEDCIECEPPPPIEVFTLIPTSTSFSTDKLPVTSMPSDQFQLVSSVVENPTPLV